MYKPAPPRPKKTSVVRSRSGCKACRQRRVKCDEKKPSCSACLRHGKKCEAITPSFEFRPGIVPASKSRGIQSSKVYDQETPVQHRAADDDMNIFGVDDPLDDLDHVDKALTPAPPHLDSNNFSLIGPSPSRFLTPYSLVPLPNPIIRRSLGRSENELFYLTYWETSCAQSLPKLMRQVAHIAEDHAPLMQALLALSACNMGRSLPESGVELSSLQVTYMPRREYLLSSQHYYSSAIRQTARIINQDSSSSAPQTLAVLVLLSHFESAMGNFTGFDYHAQGIDTFIRTHLSAISSGPLGCGLIAAWILAKNHTWWLRMNFSSVSFQLSQGPLCLSPDISNILRSINSRRAVVTSILCESYRINSIAFLQLGPYWGQALEVNVDECIASLQVESKKLDDWHTALPQSELPIESFSSVETPWQKDMRPLQFKSHFPAMNYAYYVSSRIMQCTALLQDLHSSHDQPSDSEMLTIDHWTKILLRIVAGLDKQNCFRENVYSIGASNLLVACLLRCHNLAFGRWIENWLREWSQLCILEEGSFPINQALEVTRLVNQERAAGNDVYAVALPEDDGGGKGKYRSYHSQQLDKILMIGRRGISRRLYTELVSVHMEG